jgi:hydroxymethylglutaryl-CoA reductase
MMKIIKWLFTTNKTFLHLDKNWGVLFRLMIENKIGSTKFPVGLVVLHQTQ